MRQYRDYNEYVKHQAEKIRLQYDTIDEWDRMNENIIFNRLSRLFLFGGMCVMCLGARLGAEVRAFKRMGALAVGIDLNPFQNNEDVLYGDFHAVKFPDGVFDFVYTNSIDHALYADKMISECHRLLKNGGILICEMDHQHPEEYEVNDTRDGKILNMILERFELVKRIPIKNEIGVTYIFKK